MNDFGNNKDMSKINKLKYFLFDKMEQSFQLWWLEEDSFDGKHFSDRQVVFVLGVIALKSNINFQKFRLDMYFLEVKLDFFYQL